MYSEIIVAVDGADISNAPIQYGIHLARQTQARLTGLFIMDGKWADFIGNDWQSSRNARQGFLDYMYREQLAQANLAKLQFENLTTSIENCVFKIETGDPTEILCGLKTGILILSRQVFQVCGRPSSKKIAQNLVKNSSQPLFLFP
jgi:hypothetical protein